ncbi:MAG: M48 family metalloprotease, partial [Dehalococcoidia bacterium]|nr:M48 family metalloprotease [Dehalococcoidia bacterium]
CLTYAFAVNWLLSNNFWNFVMRFRFGVPGTTVPIPPYVRMMADVAGVKIKKYHEVSGWFNAAVRSDGSLVVGSRIWTDLTKSETHAVIGHEIGHLKDFQSARFLLLIGLASISIPFMALPATQFPPVVSIPSALSSTLLIVWSLRWYLERRADRFSASQFGSRSMIFALAKLWKIGSNADCPSITHPSFESRITRLRRNSLPKKQKD